MSAFEEWCRVEEGVALSCLADGCEWWALVQWGDFAAPAPSDAVRLYNAHHQAKHGYPVICENCGTRSHDDRFELAGSRLVLGACCSSAAEISGTGTGPNLLTPRSEP